MDTSNNMVKRTIWLYSQDGNNKSLYLQSNCINNLYINQNGLYIGESCTLPDDDDTITFLSDCEIINNLQKDVTLNGITIPAGETKTIINHNSDTITKTPLTLSEDTEVARADAVSALCGYENRNIKVYSFEAEKDKTYSISVSGNEWNEKTCLLSDMSGNWENANLSEFGGFTSFKANKSGTYYLVQSIAESESADEPLSITVNNTSDSLGLFDEKGVLKSGSKLFIFDKDGQVMYAVTDEFLLNDKVKAIGYPITSEEPLFFSKELDKQVNVEFSDNTPRTIYIGNLQIASGKDFNVKEQNNVTFKGANLEYDSAYFSNNTDITFDCDTQFKTITNSDVLTFKKQATAENITTKKLTNDADSSIKARNITIQSKTFTDVSKMAGLAEITGTLSYNAVLDLPSDNKDINILKSTDSASILNNSCNLNVNRLDVHKVSNDMSIEVCGVMINQDMYTARKASSLQINHNAVFYQNGTIASA